MLIVDAHEDLAWNVLTFGRNYLRSTEETRTLEIDTDVPAHNGHTLLGWPEWVLGRVAVIFSTLFAAPVRWQEGPWDTMVYADADEAHRLYQANLDVYLRLEEEHSDRFRVVRALPDLDAVLSSWEGEEPSAPQIGLVLLMEGADGVRHVDELVEWFEAGIRIVGPAWERTRYAGGTREPGPLTDDGRAFLEMMAGLGMILDLSHMTEEGVEEALDTYPGVLIASHSNPKARIPNNEKPFRHLSDALLRRIAERDGVVGTLIANHFLKDGWQVDDGREVVTLEDVATCIDHVCQVIGDARHVGIGSDFDGGFGLNKVPTGLDSVADLRLIGDALQTRGYDSGDVEAILGVNWVRVLRRALPEN
ncbi:MAG: peptidase M19 [Anaerolineales bacterium]|nr:peptidase M19 [Anaerolineales bacterium]